MGFVGILVFEGIMDVGGVDAITVDSKGGGDYSTIQAAIDSASPGAKIYVWAGTYYENVIVNKSVTIIGNGTKNTIINGGNTGDVVNISADKVTLARVAITNSGDNYYDTDAGIEVFYADDVHIYDINCSNNFFGIFLNYTDRFAINDSIISWNQIGIVAYYSNSNKIFNNFCNWNVNQGIILFFSNLNNIDNNIISFNSGYGIDAIFSDSNIIRNNTCCSNEDGMDFYLTTSSIIENNTCNWNYYYGFWMDSANLNYFINNTCSNNNEGIDILDSDYNYFINNTCDSNMWYGMYLWTVSNSYFINNTCSNTDVGLSLSYSSQNTFQWNNFSKNRNGIYLELECRSNTFFENIIARNTGWGITIESQSNNNLLYHNLIISNSQQARDQCNNNWDYNNEGNYWSDYSGLDNGAGGRVAGDGIGDTNIPHPGPGMDNYPFIEPYGWIYPGIPILMAPDGIDFDGSFMLKWNETCRCIGYILEEAEEQTFTSPIEIYEGEDLNCCIDGKNNGTFYYRIKAYNDYFVSDWSNIVNITVDWPPNPPVDLVASNPTGHEISLSWELSPDSDIQGYYIMKNITNGDDSGPFKLVTSVFSNVTEYTITGLCEETTYHFMLLAYDFHNTNSTRSNVASETTLDVTAPAAPEGLTSKVVSESEIKLTWDANEEQDLGGYIIFMNESGDNPSENFYVIHTITGTDTSYTVSGLTEQTTYYFKIKAFDEVPNNSSFSNMTSATTPDVTPPTVPTGLNVSNSTVHSLTLSWESNPEADVVGYILFRSMALDTTFINISLELITDTQYIDTGLEEATIYYYKLKAVDDVGLESDFTEAVLGMTILDQHPPEINRSIKDFNIKEDTIDDQSINLYYWFKDINNDPLNFRCDGEMEIEVIIYQENGTVVLIPRSDWSGEETLIFYASDGIDEIFDEVTITVLPVNDPPGQPRITSVDDGIKIKEGETLDLEGECSDPDLPYGDELTFVWSSNIAGKLGTGKLQKDVILPVGKHLITLAVTDKKGESSLATINVTVLEKSTDQISDINVSIIAGVIIVIIVVMVLLFLMLQKRRKQKESAEEQELPAIQPTQVFPQPPGVPGPFIQPLPQQPFGPYQPGSQLTMTYPYPPQQQAMVQPFTSEPQGPTQMPVPTTPAMPPVMPQETTQTLLPGPPPSLPPAGMTMTAEVPTEPTQPTTDEDATESESTMIPTPQQPPSESQTQQADPSSPQAQSKVEKEQKEQGEEKTNNLE